MDTVVYTELTELADKGSKEARLYLALSEIRNSNYLISSAVFDEIR